MLDLINLEDLRFHRRTVRVKSRGIFPIMLKTNKYVEPTFYLDDMDEFELERQLKQIDPAVSAP